MFRQSRDIKQRVSITKIIERIDINQTTCLQKKSFPRSVHLKIWIILLWTSEIILKEWWYTCTDAKYIHVNGKYCTIIHEKWNIWSDFPWENHPPYKIQIYRTVTKLLKSIGLIFVKKFFLVFQWAFLQRYVLDKLQKRPVRFLVALNTLNKFLGRHAQVEDVITWFGSVLCSLQISYVNVLYRLKKCYTCAI